MYEQITKKNQFLDLMESSDCDSWLKGKKMIDSIFQSEPFLPSVFKTSIKSSLRKVKNLLMLIYLHSLEIDDQPSFIYKDPYRQKFQEICMDRQGTYWQILLWLQEQLGETHQMVVQFILKDFPSFLNTKKIIMTPFELNFMMRIFNKLEANTNSSFLTLTDFISCLQDANIGELNPYDCKENAIIYAALLAATDESGGKGNLNLVLDDYLLGRHEDQRVSNFCFYYAGYLQDLTIKQLLKAFHELFLKGINAHLLELVLRTSNILAEGEEFFKLKQLYAEFILPVVARRAKGCLRDGVEKAALTVCQLYTVGFNPYCDIGEIGAECLLANIQGVSSQNYRKRWMELAFFTSKSQAVTQRIQSQLRSQGIDERLIGECKNGLIQKEPWQVTARNIRQHKNYNKHPSQYKGISNGRFQCYIISVVQALFMNTKLFQLLAKTSKYQKCVNSLMEVFRDLEKKQKRTKIKVKELQKNGPIQFAESEAQEDAQQYLLALMAVLESYFKAAGLQRQFKEMFQLRSQTTLACKHCSHSTTSSQAEYTLTISHKEKLRVQYQQSISDFTCSECNHKEFIKKTVLRLTPQILIVHINRFSNVGETIRKELPSQRIPRRFQGYLLVGMIFHIGKIVEAGHYVFYARLTPRKWVEFNDENTAQLELQEDGEEFQREFKAEKTPYILFYQKEQ